MPQPYQLFLFRRQVARSNQAMTLNPLYQQNSSFLQVAHKHINHPLHNHTKHGVGGEELQQILIILFVSMLPLLVKNQQKEKEFRPADTKLYNPPRQLSQQRPRVALHDSSRNSNKSKVGGGFRLNANHEERTDPRLGEYVAQQSRTIGYVPSQKGSNTDISQEIKAIEKKIRQCQQKLQRDKRRKAEEERRVAENRYEQDFQEVVRRELELQGYQDNSNAKNFDYLTNPGGPPQDEPTEEEVAVAEPEAPPAPPYSIAEGMEKLQRFYENSLKKKFERRQAFPHQACRRKTPKLYITQKTNALSKHGKPLSEEQHKFRVLTRETTPQEIYPVIPNFAVVKDSLSKNIVAYLGDYRPFLDKTREKKELRQAGEVEGGNVSQLERGLSVGN